MWGRYIRKGDNIVLNLAKTMNRPCLKIVMKLHLELLGIYLYHIPH